MKQKDPVIIAKILSSLIIKYDNIHTIWFILCTTSRIDDWAIDRLFNINEKMRNMQILIKRRKKPIQEDIERIIFAVILVILMVMIKI